MAAFCVIENCPKEKHPKAGYGMCHTHYWQKYRKENRSTLDKYYSSWKTRRGSRWAKMSEREKNTLRAQNARRRALTRGATIFLVLEKELRKLLDRYNQSCAYCNTALVTPHWDHVVPLALGGQHSIGNLLPACADCNKSKGSATLMEWRYAVANNLPIPKHKYKERLK